MNEEAGAPLTLQEVSDIITKAKSAGNDPLLIAMEIFNALGDSVILSGDTLRMALTEAVVPILGPLAPFVSSLQSISKIGTHVSTRTGQDIETKLNGIRIRFKEDVSFDVTNVPGNPALNNIAGVSAHKVLWIDIKSLELRQDQGHWSLEVVTPVKTITFDLN
jgi:hypothetical protein